MHPEGLGPSVAQSRDLSRVLIGPSVSTSSKDKDEGCSRATLLLRRLISPLANKETVSTTSQRKVTLFFTFPDDILELFL